MDDLLKWKIINRLKGVQRMNTVSDRKESSAEHSWSALMLADYFLEKEELALDKMKVFELLLYHDVVEIEADDTPLHPEKENKEQAALELVAARKLSRRLPIITGEKFLRLFHEFEAQETIEARFAKAIDKFDAIVHEVDYKADWKGWTKGFLLEKKGPFMKEFPEIDKAFHTLMTIMQEEGYFDQ